MTELLPDYIEFERVGSVRARKSGNQFFTTMSVREGERFTYNGNLWEVIAVLRTNPFIKFEAILIQPERPQSA